MRFRTLTAALLASGCALVPDSAPPILRDLEPLLARAGGTWGIYFHDLETGETVERNARRLFHAASTMKVLVLMKVHRDLEDGKYRLDEEIPVHDTFPGAVGGQFRTDPEAPAVREAVGKSMRIRDLVECMIVASDNLATNVLIERAGGPRAVTEHARLHGLERTTVARYIMDEKAFEAGLSSRAEPREMGLLLEKLWRGEVVSRLASGEMLDVMSRLDRKWLGLKLPQGARVAHKTGAIEGTRHDVGVITLPGGRAFVLCVYSEGLRDEKAAEEVLGEIARRFGERVAGR